jgi:hypothetical protein
MEQIHDRVAGLDVHRAQYRQIARRRGRGKAAVAVAHSLLDVIWHLLREATSRFWVMAKSESVAESSRPVKTGQNAHPLYAA